MPRLALSGYYGFGNVGDEAVLAGTLALLRENFPECEAVIFSATPEATTQRHGVAAVDRRSMGQMAAALGDVDLLLSGGGTLFQDVTSRMSPLYYLQVLRLAMRRRKRTMIYCQGFGPLASPLNRWACRRILNRCDAVTVRDELAAQAMRRLHGIRKNIVVCADPSWGLTADREHGERMLTGCGVVHRPVIAWAWRSWPLAPSLAEAASAVITQVTARIGGTALLVPFHGAADREYAAALSEQTTAPTVIATPSDNPADILDLISAADFVVGMRLHALLFAAVAGVPAAGVSYDPKVDGLCEQLGLPLAGQVTDQNPELWSTAILGAWEHRSPLATQLHVAARRQRADVIRALRIARELCTEGSCT